MTSECNLSLLCSTIVSMYRYKNSGNSFAMEIWQTKPAAQSLLFDLGKTVHLMVSVTIESERPTCDFLSLPSFYVLSVALFFFFAWNSSPFFPLHIQFTRLFPTFSMKPPLTRLSLVLWHLAHPTIF